MGIMLKIRALRFPYRWYNRPLARLPKMAPKGASDPTHEAWFELKGISLPCASSCGRTGEV